MTPSPMSRADKWTVSFDVDGLLVKNYFLSNVFPRVLKEYSKPLSRLDIEKQDELVSELKEIHERRLNGEDPVSALNWDEIVVELIPEASLSEKPIADLLKSELSREKPEIYPEVEDVLEELTECGRINPVVLSNGYTSYQELVLEGSGLKDKFSRIYGPDVTNSLKPNPETYRFIDEREENYILHVGDKEVDVLGANSCNLTSWMVLRDLDIDQKKYLERRRKKDRRKIKNITDGLRPDFLSSTLIPAGDILSTVGK